MESDWIIHRKRRLSYREGKQALLYTEERHSEDLKLQELRFHKTQKLSISSKAPISNK